MNILLLSLTAPLASFFISKTSIFLSSGFYATNKQFASEMPIRRINFENISKKGKHDKIVSLVSDVIQLKEKFNSKNLKHKRNLLSRQIDAIIEQINNLIYSLYDLTNEEIKVIDESLK